MKKIITTKIFQVIQKFNNKKMTKKEAGIVMFCIRESIKKGVPLNLMEFTCSTINPHYMFDLKNPEKYVSLNPENNNLNTDISVLLSFIKELSKVYPVKLTILIGNTDPYYIYTQEWKLIPGTDSKLLWRKYSSRWSEYKTNLFKWLRKRLPDIKFEVISWYELEKQREQKSRVSFQKQFGIVYGNIDNYFSRKEFLWEYNSLSSNFGNGKYFGNLEKPSENILKNWVERKFAEYAVQGLWLKELFPYSILLQNEKPSYLRTKMYQPLINARAKSVLPVIYPFGIDNKGFI